LAIPRPPSSAPDLVAQARRIKPDDKLIIVSDVQAKDRRIDSIQLRTVQ